jgi:hypothetical protein
VTLDEKLDDLARAERLEPVEESLPRLVAVRQARWVEDFEEHVADAKGVPGRRARGDFRPRRASRESNRLCRSIERP